MAGTARLRVGRDEPGAGRSGSRSPGRQRFVRARGQFRRPDRHCRHRDFAGQYAPCRTESPCCSNTSHGPDPSNVPQPRKTERPMPWSLAAIAWTRSNSLDSNLGIAPWRRIPIRVFDCPWRASAVGSSSEPTHRKRAAASCQRPAVRCPDRIAPRELISGIGGWW